MELSVSFAFVLKNDSDVISLLKQDQNLTSNRPLTKEIASQKPPTQCAAE